MFRRGTLRQRNALPRHGAARRRPFSRTVRRLGPLPTAFACRVACELLEALEHARLRGVVHRDVAPKNVFLEIDGTIRLADWGLASLGDDAAEDGVRSLSTGTGEFWGTPSYCAPEQIRDFSRCDSRADVYSAGCTLVHLLSGVSPGPALKHSSALVLVGSDRSPLLAHRPDLPEGLVEALQAMLQEDKGLRPTTPGLAAARLRPFVDLSVDACVEQLRLADDELAPAISEPPRPDRDAATRVGTLVTEAAPLLRASADMELNSRLQAVAAAVAGPPRATLVRVGILGDPGAGKTDLLRALIPELSELPWQTRSSRLVSLRYAEHLEARVGRRGGEVEGPLDLTGLVARTAGDNAEPLAVELGLPAGLLARGLSFHEFQTGLSTADPFSVAETALLDVDVVVVCVPPDLRLPAPQRWDAMLKRNGHEALLFAVTRMDSVRRPSERRRLVALARERLGALRASGEEGVLFVSTLDRGVIYDESGEIGGIEILKGRLLRFLTTWSFRIRAMRPLQLLDRTLGELLASGGLSGELERLASSVRLHIRDLTASLQEIEGRP
ncbi:MAG: protein kinase [Planctomycetes bacterium]|nr:protein kinase [Planctomycetota bacterium]